MFRLIWTVFLVLGFVAFNAPSVQAISLSNELPRRKVIVLDPGHGGHDLGAVGPSGLAEKDVTLSVALKIKEILFGAYEVHLTRNDDYNIEIEDRTAVANHYHADIFISIHAGGGFRHQARGVAIFHHSPGTVVGSTPPQQGRDSRGTHVKPIPWNYIQEVYTEKNRVLSKLVLRNLMAKLSTVDRGVREAPCLVLEGADMPAILVEIGHLSHPSDERELKNAKVISAAAEAICEGIEEYFTQYP